MGRGGWCAAGRAGRVPPRRSPRPRTLSLAAGSATLVQWALPHPGALLHSPAPPEAPWWPPAGRRGRVRALGGGSTPAPRPLESGRPRNSIVYTFRGRSSSSVVRVPPLSVGCARKGRECEGGVMSSNLIWSNQRHHFGPFGVPRPPQGAPQPRPSLRRLGAGVPSHHGAEGAAQPTAGRSGVARGTDVRRVCPSASPCQPSRPRPRPPLHSRQRPARRTMPSARNGRMVGGAARGRPPPSALSPQSPPQGSTHRPSPTSTRTPACG